MLSWSTTLLTHTSGITPECVEAYAATKLERGELVLDEAACPGISMVPLRAMGQPCLYDGPLAMRPGSDMSYCNLNYTLLADIVGRVAGMPAGTVAEERVFGPLGMVDTCFALLRHASLDSSAVPATIPLWG